MPETPRPHRSLWPRLLLALGVLLATVVALELTSRAVLGASFVPGELRAATWKGCGRYDARRGWSQLAGVRARISGNGLDYRVRTNASGWRDPERARPAPAGVRRVLLLGDSVTWGWGVEEGERFSDLLDARLGDDVEVLNLAVPGYGTDQQVWTLLEDGLAFEPDLVALCFVYNDLFEIEAEEIYGMPKPRFVQAEGGWEVDGRPVPARRPAWKRALLRAWRVSVSRSALLTLLVHGSSPPSPGEPDAPLVERRPAEVHLASMRERYDELVREGSPVRMLLARLRDVCAENDLPLLVFNVPHKHDEYLYEPRVPAPVIDEPEAYATYLSTRLARAGEELGFETLCVDAALLAEVSRDRRLHVGDGHLAPGGHEVVARVLEPRLRELLTR